MRNRKPPFEITNAILDEIAEIAELVGHVNASLGLSTNPTLRRTNRLRTIYSSLATHLTQDDWVITNVE